MNHKEKTELGWEIANWLHNHEDFERELADNIFFGMKIGKTIGESDLMAMIKNRTDCPFSATDLLSYLRKKNRQEKIILKHSL